MYFVAWLFLSGVAAETSDTAVVTETHLSPDGATSEVIEYVGMSNQHANQFLGIPFAQPPVGELRWRAPQALPFRAGSRRTVKATRFGPACTQEIPPPAVPFLLAPNPDGSWQSESEDCLYLNIWTPRNATNASRLPVLVWAYGGGDGAGSNGQGWPLLWNGTSIARASNAISVVLNYRVSEMGYLAHPAFASEDKDYPTTGNYGIMDNVVALKWIQEHIGAFGGDKSKVFFYGQSSGGNHAVWILALPHLFSGLVTGVAAHSSCMAPLRTHFPHGCCWEQSRAEAKIKAELVATLMNCTVAEVGSSDAAMRACMRSKPYIDIRHAIKGIVNFALAGTARPLIDGWAVPDEPYLLLRQSRYTRNVNFFIGHNGGEKGHCGSDTMNLSYAGMRDSLAESMQDNGIKPPEWLKNESMALYLPPRKDGLEPCIPKRLYPDGTGRPGCCDVWGQYENDLDHTCSEESLIRNLYRGAQAAGEKAPPAVHTWKFHSGGHGDELTYIFGTHSNGVPPAANPELAPQERAFSDNVIRMWTNMASTGSPGYGWPLWATPAENSDWGSDEGLGVTKRMDLDQATGNFTVVKAFRKKYCSWWETVFQRMRSQMDEGETALFV